MDLIDTKTADASLETRSCVRPVTLCDIYLTMHDGVTPVIRIFGTQVRRFKACVNYKQTTIFALF